MLHRSRDSAQAMVSGIAARTFHRSWEERAGTLGHEFDPDVGFDPALDPELGPDSPRTMTMEPLAFPRTAAPTLTFAEHHVAAANHHDQAALHHRQAALYRDAKNYLLAAEEVHHANEHAITALYHSNEAAKYLEG